MARRKKKLDAEKLPETKVATVSAGNEEPEQNVWDEKSKERVREDCRERGYVSTHTICSAVGYLIGVRRRNFMDDDELVWMQRSVYERLDKNPACRAVRNLCLIRAAIMRSFGEACSAVKGMSYSAFLSKYTNQTDVMSRLYWDGCSLPSPSPTVDMNEYLMHINRKLGENLERLRRLPEFEGIKFDYIKKALLYPGGLKKDQIESIQFSKKDVRKTYPFECYLNLEMPRKGNILDGDDGFVELLYQQNRDTVPDIGRFRRSYGDAGLEKLTRFMGPEGNYQYRVYIDGAGIHTKELRPLLSCIHEINPEQLGECVLFCPHEEGERWEEWLRKESELVTRCEPRQEYASQEWASQVAADIGTRDMEVPEGMSVAYVLVTPSGELLEDLKMAGILKRSVFVIFDRQPSDLLLRQLNSRRDYCVLTELIGEQPAEETSSVQDEERAMALAALKGGFPLDIKRNLQEIVQRKLAPLPVVYSPEKQEQYFQLLQQAIRVKVDGKGQLWLTLDEEVLDKTDVKE